MRASQITCSNGHKLKVTACISFSFIWIIWHTT